MFLMDAVLPQGFLTVLKQTGFRETKNPEPSIYDEVLDPTEVTVVSWVQGCGHRLTRSLHPNCPNSHVSVTTLVNTALGEAPR